ncbi:cyclic di-AMP synthase CdaA [Planctomycetales bacterium]|nr:cyclic di-AMP synthase CdaA [Planctomycetales bacterium]GHS97216.1 cyclic di-AMP synthase CdaA [Planctomycetales bacterium]GHT05693.1 cyclic di-AMP synthase CdaA [Planctomycetales bacterium]GHV21086.1 cyclic di-AMP synthase CdaA [Planctomycetales bacterium]
MEFLADLKSLFSFAHANWHLAAIEIFLIVAIAYAVLRMLRGTLGAEIARGAVLLMVTFIVGLYASKLFNLGNLQAILESLVGVSLFALVVIFQPEIRRLLVRIGESAMSDAKRKTVNLAKEITESAFHISELNQIGALIVVERKSQTGTFIESGAPVDSLISARVLNTIFTKNSPLHDGATIIKNGRIAASHCLLPLSENVEVCRGLGTRHRAAVGLSEITDAIAVIISEETGRVSVALGGQLSPPLDYEGLLKLLTKELAETAVGEPKEIKS